MASEDKCRLKIKTVTGLIDTLDLAHDNALKNSIGMRAAADALEVVLKRMAGLRGQLHSDLKAGNVPPAAKDHVELYLSRAIGVVAATKSSLEREVVKSHGFTEGIEQAARIIAGERTREQRKLKALKRAAASPPEPPEPQDEQEGEDRLEAPALCNHCGDRETNEATICESCARYERRYGKLPPDEVLDRRRAKLAEAANGPQDP